MAPSGLTEYQSPRWSERLRRTGIALAIALTLGLGAGVAQEISLAPHGVSAQSAATQADVASVAAKANPGVVTIVTMQQMSDVQGGFQQQVPDQNGESLVPVGSGSGFIIDEAGHVVTNSHVVNGGSGFEVQFYDGTTAMATLVGADPFQDVAVLQLQLEAGQTVPGIVQFGDSDLVRAGDPVVAIGTPYGEYDNTVTSGIINAVERGLDTQSGFSLPNLLQHDADIYPGNSGGPLLNAEGEVIGINVAKAFNQQMGAFGEDGFNFAIESNAAKEIVDEIIADGQFDRAYLGIRGETTGQGIAIVSVEAGGPAEAAGLQPGDVITGVQGVDGDLPNEALDTVLFDRKPGDQVTLEVVRDGQSITIDLILGERPTEPAS
ncbi:MAG: S1C family serine protease [Thermomicrobiales bacterium]